MSFPRTRESRRPRRSLNLSAPTMGPDRRRRIVALDTRFRGCDKWDRHAIQGSPTYAARASSVRLMISEATGGRNSASNGPSNGSYARQRPTELV